MAELYYYDELKQIGVDYADKKQVEEYDAQMQKFRDIKKEIEEISTAINLKAEQVIVEIGTGTGEFAIEASKYCINMANYFNKFLATYICTKKKTG
ncbi:MAG: hypothetical protein GXZ07_04425 [Firmicutes bacterium]|nr:hypothetical protein [Bacillota bacterium]